MADKTAANFYDAMPGMNGNAKSGMGTNSPRPGVRYCLHPEGFPNAYFRGPEAIGPLTGLATYPAILGVSGHMLYVGIKQDLA